MYIEDVPDEDYIEELKGKCSQVTLVTYRFLNKHPVPSSVAAPLSQGTGFKEVDEPYTLMLSSIIVSLNVGQLERD